MEKHNPLYKTGAFYIKHQNYANFSKYIHQKQENS